MLALSQRLGVYLDGVFDADFSAAGHDCLTFCADWLLQVTGRDVAGPWRNTYSTPIGAARILRESGGIFTFTAKAMAREGFAPAMAPQLGDVGLIRGIATNDREAVAGAICVAPGLWAALTRRGLIEARTQPVAAWSLGMEI